MHRFYLPPEACNCSLLTLTEREAHHAVHVLRVRLGDRVIVLDGAGRTLVCEVCAQNREEVRLAVIEGKSASPLPCRVTLLQALPKGKVIESIIQKATELGVHRVVPLLSERTATLLDAERAPGKGERWRLAAIEAVKQCGNPWLPKIENPMALDDFIARREEFELALVASLQGDGLHPRQFFQTFRDKHGRVPNTACLWVGPEGDFTPTEINTIKANGALPITLGPLVLRSETAAVYCLSIVSYELQTPAGPPRFLDLDQPGTVEKPPRD
jgi:16S rRNA (uracil1498-N3)-methyltransferase